MFRLTETDSEVTAICFDVGFTSLGTFSRTFRDIVGESPTSYRQRAPVAMAPTCFLMAGIASEHFWRSGLAERALG